MKQVPNKAVFFLWVAFNLFFFREAFVWFYKVLIGLHDLFNSVFLLLLLFLIAKHTAIRNEQFHFSYSVLPLLLCSLSIVGYYVSENVIQVHTLSFIFFLIYAFGFLGFFIPNTQWKKYIIPLGLLIMILPFGNILDLYVGFPLRMISVTSVSVFFEYLNINYVSLDTIITVENNSSMVDFSCSGIKGLWAGLIFYFTNTWLKNYSINLRWFAIGGMLLFLIWLLNTVRILILVYVDLVLELPNISDIIHVPLGIFGFVFSCAITYFSSNYVLGTSIKTTTQKSKKQPYHFSYKVLILPVLQIILFFNINEKETPTITLQTKHFTPHFIKSWHMSTIESSTEERKFIAVNGGGIHKFSFFDTNIKGNGFVFKSKTWRSHHNPEYCITSGGRKIVKSETLKLNSINTLKKILLDNGQNGYYWFQNKSYTTDDFGTRIWNEIFKQETDWLLVCVIFNSNKNNDQKENFIQQIKNQL